jgi:hypothetical protein
MVFSLHLHLAESYPTRYLNLRARSESSTHSPLRSRVGAEDVGVTSVKDGHGRAPEELTTGGTKLDLYFAQVS